jgi:sec-independent protein translocase protein TatA
MIGTIGLPQLLVVLAIVLVFFGAGRLSRLGKEMGGAIKEFRSTVTDAKAAEAEAAAPSPAAPAEPASPGAYDVPPPPPPQGGGPRNLF